MTRCGDSRKESGSLTYLLSARKTSRIGTWNVRTLYDIGRTMEVAKEMKHYRISILGLCETRWTGTGKSILNSGETILFSGHTEENSPHSEGVALMLSKEADRALIEWEAVSPRIVRASFRTVKQKVNMSVIQCYALTNDKDAFVKEEFYMQLQNIINNERKGNLKILMFLGKKERKHKAWITPETIKLIEDRKSKKAELNNSKTRAAKARAQENYTEANKEVRRHIRADKVKYQNDLAQEAETAAAKGNLRDLYSNTRKLVGKYSQPTGSIKNSQGKVLTNTKDQMDRWVEYFEMLLNRPDREVSPDIQPLEMELDINCEIPSKKEIRKAINLLKEGKASGPDGIPAEAIRTNINTSTELLHRLF
ncbi:unnamed protein product, partial [Candidula unifasciata]